jgi:hypothetical protein
MALEIAEMGPDSSNLDLLMVLMAASIRGSAY